MSETKAKAISKRIKPGAGLKNMLASDFRRMMCTSRFWIMLGIALLMPVLVLVMTSSMGTDDTVAFTSAWQIIGTESGAGSAMAMDMTSMCNINLIFFLTGVFVCLFVSDDFVSGHSKNIFTLHVNKGDYTISKLIVSFIAGAAMLIAFFIGGIIGGGAAGLSFELGSAGAFGLVMCMIAKIFLMNVFTSIALLTSAFGRQKRWLSILLFGFAGMLLFMMIPMMTPLNSGFMNVIMCLAGGILFAIGLGKVSSVVLNKIDLV